MDVARFRRSKAKTPSTRCWVDAILHYMLDLVAIAFVIMSTSFASCSLMKKYEEDRSYRKSYKSIRRSISTLEKAFGEKEGGEKRGEACKGSLSKCSNARSN